MKTLSCLALLITTVLPAAAEECRINPGNNESAAGLRWTGPCKDGWAEGVGVLEKKGADGWRYEGALLAGQRSGHGYLRYSDGTQYEGAFLKGELEGMAIYLNPAGDRYDGQFKAGRREGRGSMVYALGGRYDGNWKNGTFHGRGLIEYPGGRKLDTTFVDGLAPGQKPAAAAPSAAKPSHKLMSKDVLTGDIVPLPIVTDSAVPLDKSYAQLNEDERKYIKARYALMDEADEPPYPLNGPAQLYRTLHEARLRTNSPGELAVAVKVDSKGRAVSAATLTAPDQEMADFAARALMLEKYKPALCAGTPCEMTFPFQMQALRRY